MGSRDDRNLNRVFVRNGDMEAYLYLSAPLGGGEYDLDSIMDLLRMN